MSLPPVNPMPTYPWILLTIISSVTMAALSQTNSHWIYLCLLPKTVLVILLKLRIISFLTKKQRMVSYYWSKFQTYSYILRIHYCQTHCISNLLFCVILSLYSYSWKESCYPLVAHVVKNLPAMQKTCVWSLGREDPLDKEMTYPHQYSRLEHSMAEESGGLQSMGLQRIGHD